VTPLRPEDSHYRNQTIRLSDLAVVSDVIEGVTFEKCQLVGPAIVVLIGNSEISGCTWDGPLEGFLFPFRSDRSLVIGAIGLMNCKLYGCRMTRLGLAVPENQMDQVKRGFGL
jgi:hypothetical protein